MAKCRAEMSGTFFIGQAKKQKNKNLSNEKWNRLRQKIWR